METIISTLKQSIKYNKKIVFNAGVESSLRYFNPTDEYVPSVSLLFSPFGLPFVPMELVSSNLKKIISDMTWTKDRSNPGGLLSITIVPDPEILNDISNIMKKFPGGSIYMKLWNALGISLEDLFKPKTVCQLWIDGYHEMTGTVRGCVRNSTVSDNSCSISYTITIDELGNEYNRQTVRLDTMLLNQLESHVVDAMNSALEATANIKGTTVQVGITAALNAFKLSTLANQGMCLSDGLPLAKRLLSLPNPLGGMALKPFAANMFINMNMFELNSQTFWEYLKNFIPQPWMEFYTESGGRTIVTDMIAPPAVLLPGFNYIVARSVPYSNPLLGTVNPVHLPMTSLYDLNMLALLAGGDFVVITDRDVHSKSIGFDSNEQATSFRATYSSGSGTNPSDVTDKPIQTIGPLNRFASGGIKTFGLTEMVQTVNCESLFELGAVSDGVLGFLSKAKISSAGTWSKPALANLLAVWFRNQSRFREGTITTRMIPWARPGMYLLYLPEFGSKRKPDDIRDIGVYYIDTIVKSYNLTDNEVTAETTFNVIRGVPLPSSIAQTALLLFDYEILPPVSGTYDGEYKALQSAYNILASVGIK